MSDFIEELKEGGKLVEMNETGYSALSKELRELGYLDYINEGTRYALIPHTYWDDVRKLMDVKESPISTPRFLKSVLVNGEKYAQCVISANLIAFSNINWESLKPYTKGVLSDPQALIKEYFNKQGIDEMDINLDNFAYDPNGAIFILKY